MKQSTISVINGLEVGDIITFSGEYQRRTLWQCITRKPKILERFRVSDTGISNDATIEEA